MMRRLIIAITTAAVTALLTVTPTDAMPVREFGPAVAIGTAGVDPYGAPLAVLPDGTTAVAWTTSGNTVHMAVRKAGTNTFTELTEHPLAPGYSLNLPSFTSLWPALTLLPAGSEFLLGWSETGATPRVQVARVSTTATAIPAPTTVSGTDAISGGTPVAFGTATDGSATAAWTLAGPLGYEMKAARRAGVSGSWQQLGSAGSVTFPYDLVAAIDTSRSVTLGWAFPAGPYVESRVRSHQGGAWGLTVISGRPSGVLATSLRYLSVASAGSATVVAAIDSTPGAPLYSGDTSARGVRILQRSSSTASWTSSGALVGPSRYAASPNVVMVPDGSAVVSFLDLKSGSTPGVVASFSTMVAQRRGITGAWGTARLADSMAISSWNIGFVLGGRLAPGLAPDGTLVIPVPAPVPDSGGSIGLSAATLWRTGWSTPLIEQATVDGPLMPFPLMTGMGLDPAGRATVAYLKGSVLGVTVASTSLPKPYVRSRASLSTTTPRVGTLVTCTSAWTGAKTLTIRWLRNTTTIAGATAQAYTPKAVDRGKQLSCRVTATNPTGSTISTSVARKVG